MAIELDGGHGDQGSGDFSCNGYGDGGCISLVLPEPVGDRQS